MGNTELYADGRYMDATSKQQGRDPACSSLGVLRPGSTERGAWRRVSCILM
jgi:hypothetical protein